ncbi:MAG: hypothetical protein A2W99_00815 [Bacteroidetes bacterium GWF2_33_16]|nr:MAG: hypothetical protein A2X00_03520 [Bacteroidetes bacterium GWE2_32_14]OFY08807.1 MAG: hypothetical protein A2W99_00815 [Bacteroidetes bacterium GWF2_33_16]
MKSKNIIIFILLVLLMGSCQPNKWEQENDAVFKSIKKEYQLNIDGSVNYQYQHKLKYITHYSFNRAFGESFIIYDPRFQQLKINKAETKMVDGQLIASPENAFNEVLPRFAAGAPAFNHLREMVVTHTGLELGCVVDFDYELNSNAGYLPYLNDNIIIQQTTPIEKMEILVKVPEGKVLNYKLLNSDVKPTISSKNGFTSYSWKFKNIEAYANESNQPNDNSFLPRLIFSTTDIKEAVSSTINNADLNLTDEIKSFVQKRVSDKKKGIQYIKELQQIVGNEINTFNIPFEFTGYSIRPLAEVWSSNGATSIEKIILFNELAKFLGLESKLIFSFPTQTYDPAIGNLKDFGNVFTYTKVDEQNLVLQCNPSQKNNLAFDIINDKVIDVNGDEVTMPDYIKETMNMISAIGNIDIMENGNYDGKLLLKISGAQYPYFDILMDVKNAKKVAESIIPSSSIGNVELINFDQASCEIQVNINGKEIWKNQGGYYFATLFTSSLGIEASHLRTLTEKRETPLNLGFPVYENYEITYSVPAGFSFVVSNMKDEIINSVGEFKFEVNKNENTIQVNKLLRINNKKILSEDYSFFKALHDGWSKEKSKLIIVKKAASID